MSVMNHKDQNEPDRLVSTEPDPSAGDRRCSFIDQVRGSCADADWSTEDLFIERRREAELEAVKERRFR